MGQGDRTAATEAFSELVAAGARAAEPGGAVDRRSISEQVAHRIMGMIKSGNLRPGDRLPTEAQMCIAFGISRPPLREALKALSLMRIVESRQGGRYTVTALNPSRLIEPFNIILAGADYDVHEHFDARAVVDLELIRLCVVRAGRDAKARILKLAVDGGAFHDDPVAFRLLDLEYHQALYTGGGNRVLSMLAEALYDMGLDIRREASALPGVIEKSVAQHVATAEAIVAGDVAAAVETYRRHLEHVRDTTVEMMRIEADRQAAREA